ncbi:MAG TPA: Kiwa anti-phage protein KwaB-like domain-containing protein [Candidatus Saccharimonadales bacterium]|nr:Kiwa anti-phage protein KwaB-like domain-containing protein [Candidatus Saccharimonadales bacterium]
MDQDQQQQQPSLHQQETDIFAWAGHVESARDALEVDLYLFNKKYTVYSAHVARELELQLKQLFLFEMLNYVSSGPDQGMVVRTFEEAEGEELVIQRTQLANVENATYILHQIEEPDEEVQLFRDDEHDFKRIKGIVARFSHPSMPRPFYVVKLVQQSQVLKGKTAWLLDGNSFKPFTADAGFKVAPDNQVVIVAEDIFVFNQRRFETLFGYNAKQQLIAKQKVAQIENLYKLSFPEGMDLNSLVKDKKSTIKKLQNLEVGRVKQDELLDHAEEMGVELMTDEGGAIIIMDGKDLDKFVNLLNDDYVESGLTGTKYEIRGKRVLGE